MPTSIVFVHGTGVRNDKTHLRLKEGLKKAGRGDIDVYPVAWGDKHGVHFTDQEIADIIAPSSKSLGEGDSDIRLWEALIEDPLLEIRLMGIRAETHNMATGAIGPDKVTPFEKYKRKLKEFTPNTPLPPDVSEEEIKEAGKWLAAQMILRPAVVAAGSANDDTLIDVSARALAAYIIAQYDPQTSDGPLALYNGKALKGLVSYLARAISPVQAKGMGGWVKKYTIDVVTNFGKRKSLELGTNVGTKIGRARRTHLMDFATPFTGDIISYQQRGEPFRQMILAEIDKIPQDRSIVLVGHSLGGVILVDVACEATRKISHLITVGSQPSFFLLSDSLESLRKGITYSNAFPNWLNIYDRNDFLSFRMKTLFSMLQNVDDVEATSGAPFPAAHGAYWRNPTVYDIIAEKCPQ